MDFVDYNELPFHIQAMVESFAYTLFARQMEERPEEDTSYEEAFQQALGYVNEQLRREELADKARWN